MTESPRVVFFGTPEFAVPSLKALQSLPLELLGVVCQPAKPAGRGHQLTPSVIEQFAHTAGLPVFTPVSLKKDSAAVANLLRSADVAVVVAYGKIIPGELLQLPRKGFVNIHPSLLPRHRGPSPIQSAILEGDEQTGVTLMQLDEGLDTGAIITQVTHPLTAFTTAPELSLRLAQIGAELLSHELLPYLNNQRVPQAQPTDGVTVTRLLTKDDGQLDWKQPAAVLERKIRALQPWPGTWTTWQGQPLRILHARLAQPSGTPGQALAAAPLRIGCGEGALEILQLQFAGKPPQAAETAINGYALLGSVFGA